MSSVAVVVEKVIFYASLSYNKENASNATVTVTVSAASSS